MVAEHFLSQPVKGKVARIAAAVGLRFHLVKGRLESARRQKGQRHLRAVLSGMGFLSIVQTTRVQGGVKGSVRMGEQGRQVRSWVSLTG